MRNMRVLPGHPKTIILFLTLMVLLSCSERRGIRQKALENAGLIVMEEPELIPLVKTLLDIDRQLEDVNRSLRGEGGAVQLSLEDLDQTLVNARSQIQDLKTLLNQQEIQIRELRRDYENQAETVRP